MSSDPKELGFERQEMVRWLSPKFLLRAGLEVAISGLFARFADKREVEAGLPTDAPQRQAPQISSLQRAGYSAASSYTGDAFRDEDGALWFDFAADVGEGFDPTYTVAWLLAQETLNVKWDGGSQGTKRGRFLVLGGDQVYPSASWEAYRDRFVGPYAAALPFVSPEEVPDLYAIPGNHDWYDGLTSFMRLFCQRSWIGGWRTQQRRSYFALQLPDKWWLWATDIQFDTYMDGPQLEYFRHKGEDLSVGDRVILVTAKPSWVGAHRDEDTAIKREGSWEALSYVEEEVIGSTGAQVALTITGDKHHYSRFARRGAGNPQHRITAGGGGAHTSATHGLEKFIHLQPHGSEASACYERLGTSPTPEESRRMRGIGVRRISREHVLGALIGGIYALLAVLLAVGIKDQDTGLESDLANEFLFGLLDAATLWSAGLVVLLWLGLCAFARRGKISKPKLFGTLHTAAHVVPAVALTIGGLILLEGWDFLSFAVREGLLLGWIVAAGLFIVGFSYGRLVFAVYLYLANRSDPAHHATEIYGGLASTEYKNFLRFRLGSKGELTIYPVGIRNCPGWQLAGPEASDADPWFVPYPADAAPKPELIEAPIEVPPARGGET